MSVFLGLKITAKFRNTGYINQIKDRYNWNIAQSYSEIIKEQIDMILQIVIKSN